MPFFGKKKVLGLGSVTCSHCHGDKGMEPLSCGLENHWNHLGQLRGVWGVVVNAAAVVD